MSSFKVRASSWGRLFDCAHAWEGTHILGLTMPSSPRALLGNAIHASTAAFDAARMIEEDISVDDTAGILVDFLRNPEQEVNWAIDDLKKAEAERIGLTLHSKYCFEVSPTYNFDAVEMTTTPMTIDCGHGINITLTGTLDRSRVRRTSAGHGISDLKTGKMAVQKGSAKTTGFAAQLGTYEMLFEHTTGEEISEPGEIIGLKTSGKPEIATGLILNAKDILVGDDESPGLIDYAKEMFRSGLFPPNNQSILCNEKYCARWSICKFKNNS